jgi:hypothetical protein
LLLLAAVAVVQFKAAVVMVVVQQVPQDMAQVE